MRIVLDAIQTISQLNIACGTSPAISVLHPRTHVQISPDVSNSAEMFNLSACTIDTLECEAMYKTGIEPPKTGMESSNLRNYNCSRIEASSAELIIVPRRISNTPARFVRFIRSLDRHPNPLDPRISPSLGTTLPTTGAQVSPGFSSAGRQVIYNGGRRLPHIGSRAGVSVPAPLAIYPGFPAIDDSDSVWPMK